MRLLSDDWVKKGYFVSDNIYDSGWKDFCQKRDEDSSILILSKIPMKKIAYFPHHKVIAAGIEIKAGKRSTTCTLAVKKGKWSKSDHPVMRALLRMAKNVILTGDFKKGACNTTIFESAVQEERLKPKSAKIFFKSEQWIATTHSIGRRSMIHHNVVDLYVVEMKEERTGMDKLFRVQLPKGTKVSFSLCPPIFAEELMNFRERKSCHRVQWNKKTPPPLKIVELPLQNFM